MTKIDWVTDRRHLTARTYGTGAALDVRVQTHQRYTYPRIDFAAWVLDQIPWRGDEVVLDVGCGSGLYVDPVLARLGREGWLLSADLSLGMLQGLARRSPAAPSSLLNADAMDLPLATGCCDVVLANHVLFHLPDIGRGVAEIHRVLRPGGALVVATNARDSMRRFMDELEAAAAHLGYRWAIPVSPVQLRFNLENGREWIERAFADIALQARDDELVFPTAGPAVAHVDSMRDTYEPQLPDGLGWESLIAQVSRQIEAVVREAGAYRVPKRTGVLIARREGERAGL